MEIKIWKRGQRDIFNKKLTHICKFIYILIYIYIYIIYIHMYLYIYVFIYISISLSICLSIYLSNQMILVSPLHPWFSYLYFYMEWNLGVFKKELSYLKLIDYVFYLIYTWRETVRQRYRNEYGKKEQF